MKTIKRIAITVLVLIVIISGAAFVYVSTGQYKAEDIAIQTMTNNNFEVRDNLTILSAEESDTALIFYPGAKVEDIAYLPFLQRLQQQGITCILVKMPFNLAVLDSNAADMIIGTLPQIKHWYVGGHSLGGAMASNYASQHLDTVAGVVLVGAYVYGDIPKEKTITIFGSNDTVLDRSKIDYTENVYEIAGGNHAQFGNYGLQADDSAADITRDEQQQAAAERITEFCFR